MQNKRTTPNDWRASTCTDRWKYYQTKNPRGGMRQLTNSQLTVARIENKRFETYYFTSYENLLQAAKRLKANWTLIFTNCITNAVRRSTILLPFIWRARISLLPRVDHLVIIILGFLSDDFELSFCVHILALYRSDCAAQPSLFPLSTNFSIRESCFVGPVALANLSKIRAT